MTTFDDFYNEWKGRRVDYDHTLGYQCVDLIRQYFLECFGLAGGGGVPTAVAYWTATPGDVLTKFAKDGSGQVNKGDVVILRTLGAAPGDYSGDGHIGIATGNGDPNSIEILEQNGAGSGTGLGSDAIRTRFVPRNRLAGVLRPIVVTPPRTPKDYIQYTALPQPYQVKRVNKLQTNWWNLSNDTDDINNFHPSAVLTVNTPFTIGGYAKNLHFPMYTYAMTPDDFNRAINGDFSTNNGINLNDLEDIPPAPYVPPAAPLDIPKVNYYDLQTSVVWFNSATDAQKDINAQGTIDKGTYVLLKSDATARQITKNNADTVTYWINDLDNKVPEVVAVPTLPVDPPKVVSEPVNDTSGTSTVDKPVIIQSSFDWLHADHHADDYISTNTTTVKIRDLDGNFDAIDLPPHAKVRIAGMAYKNGVNYGLDERVIAGGYRNGIPMSMLKPATMKNRLDSNNDGRVDIQDVAGIGNYIETESRKAYYTTQRLIRDIAPTKLYEAAQRGRQFIDGIRSRK